MSGDRVCVELTRSGGFLGLSTQMVVDSAEMDAAEAARFRSLVNDAEADARPSAPPGMPDQFSYDLIIHRGSHRSTFRITEAHVTPVQRQLLAEIRRLASQRPEPQS
jgi:hypothetical protein